MIDELSFTRVPQLPCPFSILIKTNPVTKQLDKYHMENGNGKIQQWWLTGLSMGEFILVFCQMLSDKNLESNLWFCRICLAGHELIYFCHGKTKTKSYLGLRHEFTLRYYTIICIIYKPQWCWALTYLS